MNREQTIKEIIEYTKKYETDKKWFKDAIKENYYKDFSNQNLNIILCNYYFKFIK